MTFDKRFLRPLYGRDLMSLLISKIDTDKMCLELELNSMMKEKNRKSIDGLYVLQNGYYKSNFLLNKNLLKSKHENINVSYDELLEKENE